MSSWRSDGIEFTVSERGLCISITDYHAGPTHLSLEVLEHLGLCASGSTDVLRPSYVLRWQSRIFRAPDKMPHGPALTDPEWSAPSGLKVGDVLLVPVREGIDIYIEDYHAPDVVVGLEQLLALGFLQRT